ncbi:hypothetical protein UY3_16482 [Chelonia mydas]|uniref:Uncharacterized protein n=1 Tax=Chelonia mydas TaxID=8469 RepID=M7AMK7_CHEMY|nr:hypothetical protein UY3_16482 [Chelonia mydas]
MRSTVEADRERLPPNLLRSSAANSTRSSYHIFPVDHGTPRSKCSPAWSTPELLNLMALWREEAVQSQLHSSHRNFYTCDQISHGMLDKGYKWDTVLCEDKGDKFSGLGTADSILNPEDEVMDEEVELEDEMGQVTRLSSTVASEDLFLTQEGSNQSQHAISGTHDAGEGDLGYGVISSGAPLGTLLEEEGEVVEGQVYTTHLLWYNYVTQSYSLLCEKGQELSQ